MVKEMKKFKPMLLSNDDYDLDKLDYSNMYISIKRDGVRAEVSAEGIVGRSLKPFENKKLNEYFSLFTFYLSSLSFVDPNIVLEAEIYCDGIPCREMAGICNSLDKEIPVGTKLYIFGLVDLDKSFEQRHNILKRIIKKDDTFEYVDQVKITTAYEAREFFSWSLEKGYEGAVLMDGNKLYKEGRVTIKQHIGFKMKPHKEEDLEIIGVTERFTNTNESQVNELGHKFKRNTVDAKLPTGIAATFTCKYNDTTTEVTIGGSEADRRLIWDNKDCYIGKYAVVKSMDYGAKDKLRHPVLINIKERCEK
jgi:hypothetical protein